MTTAAARALAAGFLLCVFALAAPARAEPAVVEAAPILQFRGVGLGSAVDGLIWRGGLVLTSAHRDFGGLSGLTFVSPQGDLVMVGDRGHFVSGRLTYDADGAPAGLADVEIVPIPDAAGAPLSSPALRDAEAVATVYREGRAVAVRVGFERQTRVADFELSGTRPQGAARPVAIPDWLAAQRGNETIESVCIAPPASPVAGSTLILTEGISQIPDTYAATLLGVRDRGDLAFAAAPGLNPTDCAFLPDGDLLVLERGLRFMTFSMQVRRIPAEAVRAGAVLTGTVILAASGRDIDNMEGLAVHSGPDGETRITLVSDDNFLSFQRSLVLQFALP